MTKPVIIMIDGDELAGWTGMRLQREKKNMTGSLEVTLFFTYVPDSPVVVNAARGREITVYIGGHLAFIGKIDKRQGAGAKKGQEGTSPSNGSGANISSSIGPNEYTVTLSARGKTKYLIDSSHQHPTTNMLKPTNKEVIETLVKPWGIQLDWKAQDIKLDKVRFRDGAKVYDEVQRIGTENGHFIYETRDGKLRVTDDTGQESGEPLILGSNILRFSAEQGEDNAKSKVKVKGQRTEKGKWGRDAIIGTEREIEDKWVGSQLPLIIQHFGDGSPEALERRANFETNIRSSESKTLTVDVFHVQMTNGEPWDIGKTHYCEVPPEGIFDEFECTALTYTVDNENTLKTTLTLSPPPKKSASSGGGVVGSFISAAAKTAAGIGSSRRRGAGVTFAAGQYPSPWSGPDVSFVPIIDPTTVIAETTNTLFSALTRPERNVPLTIKTED